MTRLRERARHVWVYIYGDTELRRRYRGDKKYKEAVKEYKERIDSGRRSRQEEDSRVSKKRDGMETAVTDSSAVTNWTANKKKTKDAPRLKEDRNKDRDDPTDIMTVTTDTDSIAEAMLSP